MLTDWSHGSLAVHMDSIRVGCTRDRSVGIVLGDGVPRNQRPAPVRSANVLPVEVACILMRRTAPAFVPLTSVQ